MKQRTAFQAQLQIVSAHEGWSEAVAAQRLPAALRGPALELFGHLPAAARGNFQALCDALQRRFGTLGQVELHRAKFRSRRQISGESLHVLSNDVENLCRMAYPEALEAVLQDQAKDKFIDALLDRELRVKLREARLQSISAATQLALEIESYRIADQDDRSARVRQVQSQDRRTPPRSSPKRERAYCTTHGRCNHTTEQCRSRRSRLSPPPTGPNRNKSSQQRQRFYCSMHGYGAHATEQCLQIPRNRQHSQGNE